MYTVYTLTQPITSRQIKSPLPDCPSGVISHNIKFKPIQISPPSVFFRAHLHHTTSNLEDPISQRDRITPKVHIYIPTLINLCQSNLMLCRIQTCPLITAALPVAPVSPVRPRPVALVGRYLFLSLSFFLFPCLCDVLMILLVLSCLNAD